MNDNTLIISVFQEGAELSGEEVSINIYHNGTLYEQRYKLIIYVVKMEPCTYKVQYRTDKLTLSVSSVVLSQRNMSVGTPV